MGEDLPNEFDLIVVGTGFTESIIAAAASRVGKSVLHLDSNDYYGGYWASFNLEAIQNLSDRVTEKKNVFTENSILLTDQVYGLENVSIKWSESSDVALEAGEDGVVPATAKQEALKQFRKFNIDLTPKLLFARGELVQLLISSNICRYAEFRSVDRVLTTMDDRLLPVPCTRSDVFSSTEVSNVERRLLMKNTLSCINFTEDSDEWRKYSGMTFAEYLADKRLTPKLVQYVQHAIAMADRDTSCFDGVRAVQKFLDSAGKYGDTPFLFPMYGCGEIPQCFCRLCAVFGGVYCLKRTISQIRFAQSNGDRRKFDSIMCGEQEIRSKQIVFGHGSIDGLDESTGPSSAKSKCGNLARGILLTNKPLGSEELNSGGGGVMFMKLPASSDSSSSDTGGAHIVQLSHYSGTCPKGWYLIHITSKTSSSTAEQDLTPYVQRLSAFFGTSSDSPIVWSMFFNIPSCRKCAGSAESPFDGAHIACGPTFEIDYDSSINNARDLFAKLYPSEEFLPRAPDPEEIIFGDDETSTAAGNVALNDVKPEENAAELEELHLDDEDNTQTPIDTKCADTE